MWAFTNDLKLIADDVGLSYRRKGFKVRTREFHYGFPAISLAGLNATATVQTAIDNDSLFVWIATACSVFSSALQQENIAFGVALKITDIQRGYNYTGLDPIPAETFCGSAEAPFVLSYPYILEPGARMNLFARHIDGIDAAATLAVNLHLLGVKMWTHPFTRERHETDC